MPVVNAERYRQDTNSVFNTATLPYSILQIVHTPTSWVVFHCFIFLSKISIAPLFFFILHILGSGYWYIIESLFCISLVMTNEVEDLYIWVLTIGYLLLWCDKLFIHSFFYRVLPVYLKEFFVFYAWVFSRYLQWGYCKYPHLLRDLSFPSLHGSL